MVTIHNLGFSRLGNNRELKFALESYWKGQTSESDLFKTAQSVRSDNWNLQKNLDFLPVGDFCLYDHILDSSYLVGNLPNRTYKNGGSDLDSYFRTARGRTQNDNHATFASEMTKWFDTNYHYIVPEFYETTEFTLNPKFLLEQITEAKSLGQNIKPVLVGPLTYLYLGKEKDESDKLSLLPKLLPVYQEIITLLAEENIEYVQIDEPILTLDLSDEWQKAFVSTYKLLGNNPIKILIATYFGSILHNIELCKNLSVAGLHLDCLTAKNDIEAIINELPEEFIISLGVINGRNIWKSDLETILTFLEPHYAKLQEKLWIAPSCSLLHVPVDLDNETKLDTQIASWLAFAKQKLQELEILKNALENGRNSVKKELEDNQTAIINRRFSQRVHNESVQKALKDVKDSDYNRQNSFDIRISKQEKAFNLPTFPTTTIGSFPQTAEIRKSRSDFKNNIITEAEYIQKMKAEIAHCVEIQTDLDIDVFVHGEAERNDMVEYFGEQLEGYIFTNFGWVQSYGSRMVKPPIIFGDISRPKAMTVEWSKYAQSLTDKYMKAMLTGPVTILNWSFVRDDQPRSETCKQLALAIRQEVSDLENAGIKIIQIDEPAIREGLPLRQKDWQAYLDWAVGCFRLTTSSVEDTTQIHTHMCYSEFNDIIKSIADMDADVITIETSRSDMELLDIFDKFKYPNDIGPGVYDIHSPNIPKEESMLRLMRLAASKINAKRLWVNPDCGLKTRQWEEVIPALKAMVSVAKTLRNEYQKELAA